MFVIVLQLLVSRAINISPVYLAARYNRNVTPKEEVRDDQLMNYNDLFLASNVALSAAPTTAKTSQLRDANRMSVKARAEFIYVVPMSTKFLAPVNDLDKHGTSFKRIAASSVQEDPTFFQLVSHQIRSKRLSGWWINKVKIWAREVILRNVLDFISEKHDESRATILAVPFNKFILSHFLRF